MLFWVSNEGDKDEVFHCITDTNIGTVTLKVYLNASLFQEVTAAFVPTVTTLGTRYIFSLTPADVYAPEEMLSTFQFGVWSFEFVYLDTTYSYGLIVDNDILCCFASKLSSLGNYCGKTDLERYYHPIAMLEGAKSQVRLGDYEAGTFTLIGMMNYCGTDCVDVASRFWTSVRPIANLDIDVLDGNN